MKEFKSLIKDNRTFLEAARTKAARPIKHFMFTSLIQGDSITIPVCGILVGVVATRTLNQVSCPECLKKVKDLAQFDTYQEALLYVAGYTPLIINPDAEIEAEVLGDMPTKRAVIHQKARAFLLERNLAKPEDLPKNIIGSEKSTFFTNLVENDLIFGPEDLEDSFGTPIKGRDIGEPNTAKLVELGDRILELSK
jgi:hypothetical protein